VGRCSSRQKAEVHLFTAADPLILASTCLLKAGKQCCYCWGFEFTVVAKMQKYSKRHGLSTCARVHIAVLLWQSRMILKIVSLLHFPHFFCCERNQILRSRRLVKPDAYMPIILSFWACTRAYGGNELDPCPVSRTARPINP